MGLFPIYWKQLQDVPAGEIILHRILTLMQFLIGVFLYREPFDLGRFIGFSIIWLTVILFIIDNVRAQPTAPKTL